MCLSHSLLLNANGVVHLLVNGKQMDAGRFLYRLKSERGLREFRRELKIKIEEFFKWYNEFTNKDPITYVELLTNDVTCDNGCHIPLAKKFSVIDVAISTAELNQILKDIGTEYGMSIELKEN